MGMKEMMLLLSETALALNAVSKTSPCTYFGEGVPPCPLPRWAPTWQLSMSTICQPGSTDGFLDATLAAKWGFISLDWSIASKIWNPDGTSASVDNATGASTLVEQCRQIKAVNNRTKCGVYRNTILALEWLEPQRAVMHSSLFADMFLKYQPSNPKGVPAGTIYNEPAGWPCNGCAQYFWNYSNPDAAQFVLGVSLQGSLATGSPYVDATFMDDILDDPSGFPEHSAAVSNMGLTKDQLSELVDAKNSFVSAAINNMASNGHYIWQAFAGAAGDGVGGGPSKSTCAAFMRRTCTADWQNVPWTMQWPATDKAQALAAFLIARGPYAYVGHGWEGSRDGQLGAFPSWDQMWDKDYGVPSGLCKQASPGVFQRLWTSGLVSLDCNSWTATLPTVELQMI